MVQNKTKQNQTVKTLTRNQILQYIAQMSEEMSNLAHKAECAELAKSLKAAASQANHLLPHGYKD